MSKQLYEEAIADVKKLKEIAEDNAKRAIIEAVAPRIRDLIEKELLGESSEESEEADPPAKDKKVLTDELEEEFVVSLEAQETPKEENVEESFSNSIEEILELEESYALNTLDAKLNYVEEFIGKIQRLPTHVTETKEYSKKVEQLMSMVDELHLFVQKEAVDPAKKLSRNLKIQNCLNRLEKLQESKMKRKNRLSEASINLELTGLPDEIDLEGLGVNLVSGEEEEEAEDTGEESGGDEGELDLGGDEGEEGGDEGGEEPAALDLGGGDEDADEGDDEEQKAESTRLRDDVIVEIDEGMLRREIARMKRIREEAVPSTKGKKPGPSEFDDFGGAEEEGEPLDLTLSEMNDPVIEIDMDEKADRTDSSPGGKARKGYTQPNTQDDYAESAFYEVDSDDMTEADEEDDMAEAAGEDEDVGEAPKARMESLRRRMRAELKLQENLKRRARAAARIYEAAKARFSRAKTLSERKEISTQGSKHKTAYTVLAKRYNESVSRFNRLSRMLNEATRKMQSSNSNAKKTAASAVTENQLRNKLAETNLVNAKLMFTNKLLQSDALTTRQKAQVIAQLDEAKSIREVKLVYESLAKTLAAPRRPVTESRVIGSSSQATRSASPQTLNEGFESERWAKLAGISK